MSTQIMYSEYPDTAKRVQKFCHLSVLTPHDEYPDTEYPNYGLRILQSCISYTHTGTGE